MQQRRVIALCLAAVACAGTEPPAPRVDSILPETAPNSAPIAVTLRGAHFYARVSTDLNSGRSTVDDHFIATLHHAASSEQLTLESVERLDDEELAAVVPAIGAPGGWYTLRLTGPYGDAAPLEEALWVCSDADADGACDSASGCADADSDGWGRLGSDDAQCSFQGVDCDDTDALIHPGASDDDCDDVDDDCNDVVDDGYVTTPTQCGQGECAGQAGMLECDAGLEVDTCDPFAGAIVEGPPGDPTCSGGLDEDCDGLTDLGDGGCVVNTPPVAIISLAPAAGDTSTVFAADGTGSWNLESPVMTYQWAWDWQDNPVFEDFTSTATHTYASEGTFQVVLAVTDGVGATGYAVREVVVTSAILEVMTDADNDNGSPPGDADFSLREAIDYANTTAGAQTLLLPDGMTVALTSELPAFTDDAGCNLVGYQASIIGQSGERCLVIDSSSNTVAGISLTGCTGYGIELVGGAGTRIIDTTLTGTGIRVQSAGNVVGPGNVVRDAAANGLTLEAACTVGGNRFLGSGQHQIFVSAGSGTIIEGNVVANGGNIGILSGADVADLVIRHNTVDGNSDKGITIGAGASGIVVANNLVTNNGRRGMNGGGFTFQDYNDFFGNLDGPCNCTPGPNSLFVDPGYVDPAAEDWRLINQSGVINMGIDLGIDVNGPESGNFNPSAPEMGAWEAAP